MSIIYLNYASEADNLSKTRAFSRSFVGGLDWDQLLVNSLRSRQLLRPINAPALN